MSVPHAVLALVAQGVGVPSNVRREFEARTGEVWPLNRGQIATTLDRLLRDGLVETESDDDGAPTYRVTPQGRDVLRTWWRDPVARDAPRRDELAIKLALAVEEPDVDLVGMIRTQRTETLRALQDLRRLGAHLPTVPQGRDLAWSLVLDGLVVDVESEIRWLDMVEGRLRAARSLTPARSAAEQSAPQEVPATKDAR